MVLKMLEKHQSLADKTNAQKKKLSADAEAAAQKRKAAAKAKREAARAKAASTPPPAPVVQAPVVPKSSEDKEPPPPGNGGIMPWGVWTQQLADLELKIPMASGTKAKQLVVDIRKQSIKVGLKGQPPALEGELHKKVIV